MIISKNFYDRCPSSYKNAIDELEQKLATIDVQDDNVSLVVQIQSAVLSFSKRYLTPKKYWKYCLRDIKRGEEISPYYQKWNECRSEIAKSIYFHFYYCDLETRETYMLYHANTDKEPKLLNFFNKDYLDEHDLKIREEDLEYPHDCLEEYFHVFERKETKIPSTKLIKRYKEMVELYQKIKAAETDDAEKWFKLVLEVGDNDFVKANVECRLGKDLLNMKLWKLYIKFLKEDGQFKLLLKTYSKYCRLFLDDVEMKEEYRQYTVKYGPIYLAWENLFEFEQNEELEDDDESDYFERERKPPLDKSLCTHFYDTCKVQHFPFRASFIRYILDNANHRILRKLFSTCKFFYAKKSTPICYFFQIRFEYFDEENLQLELSSNLELFVKNTYITGGISVGHSWSKKERDDPYFLSNIIPRLYRCEAKFISLFNQNLSFKEVKFLIKHGGVVDLKIYDCKIKDDNDKDVFLEDIMAFLPNIEELKLSEIKTNANTGHALSNQKIFGKINIFSVSRVLGVPFDSNEFLKFLIANRDEKSLWCSIDFSDDFDVIFVEKFRKIMKGYVESCTNIETEFRVNGRSYEKQNSV